MAISFPTGLDNFTNPSSGNTLDSPSHSLQHSDINDAVEALERKVGLGTAVAGSASAGQVLTISAAGTSTWSTPATAGLVQIVPSSVAVGSGSGSVDANGAVTFSGASSVSLNDVFSATYNSYKIIIRITDTASDGFMNLRFRVSGTDATAANYSSAYYGISAAFSADAGGSSATTAAYVGYSENANEFAFSAVELVNPFLTQPTIFNSIGAYKTAANNLTILNCGGGLDNTTSYTGFTVLSPGNGNATGTISVYGYR